jgi:hypothetical protein
MALDGVGEAGGIVVGQQRHVLASEHSVLIEVLAAGNAGVAEASQRGAERAALGCELCVEVGVARGTKRETFFLAIDDETYGDALHAPGAETGLDFFPEDRRQRVAVEPIENAAALLGAYQVVVDIVRLRDRLLDGLLRNLVKDNPLDRDLRLEHFEEVPADRLPFAIGVGREHHFGRAFQRGPQLRDVLPFVVGHDVIRLEVAVGVDADPSPLLLLDLFGHLARRVRKIANVSKTRLHAISIAEKSLERTRLRRRFHDYKGLCHSPASP